MLSEYIDDRLPGDERADMEQHIEKCADCLRELESLQMTVRLLNQLPSIPVPRSFVVRETDVVRETEQRREGRGELQPVPVYATSQADTGRLSNGCVRRPHLLLLPLLYY
jgi:anti-sigma factor RsiW